jgi:hypothetical protein
VKRKLPGEAMKEKIFDFIVEQGPGVSSAALVRTFLKADYDNESVASKIISSVLGDDGRFEYVESLGWIIAEKRKKSTHLLKQKFVIFTANIAEEGKYKGRICVASFNRIINGREESSFQIDPPSGIKIKSAREIILFCQNAILIFFGASSLLRQLQIEVKNKTDTPLDNEYLSLQKVLSSLYGLKRSAPLDDVAKSLGISTFSGESAEMKARALTEIFLLLLDHLLEAGIHYVDDLKILEEHDGEEVDFSHFNFDDSYLQRLPETPGIYRFLDERDEPIYIGKAKNLKRRVSSYFLNFSRKPPKIESIHKSLKKIIYEETGSELEALLRESELIQSLRPPLNKQYLVHERVPSYAKRGNLIILVPEIAAKGLVLYFIKEGTLIKRKKIKKEKTGFQDIRNLLKSKYFSEKKTSKKQKSSRRTPRDASPDIHMELISSYLRENKDRLNWFDPTDYETPDDVIQIIKSYLKAPPQKEERIIHI